MSAPVGGPDPPPTRPRRGCGRTAAWGCGPLLGCVLIAGGGIWWAGSADAPPPDDADLWVTRPDVDPETNAHHWLEVAGARFVHLTAAAEAAGADTDPVGCLDAFARVGLGAPEPGDAPWDDARVADALARGADVLAALERAAAASVAQPDRPATASAMDFTGLFNGVQARDLWKTAVEAHRRAGRYGPALDGVRGQLRVGELLGHGAGGPVYTMLGDLWVGDALTALRCLAADPACPPDVLEAAADAVGALAPPVADLGGALRAEYVMLSLSLQAAAEGREALLGDRPTRPGFGFHPNRTQGLLAAHVRRLLVDAVAVPPRPTPLTDPAPTGWRRTMERWLVGNAQGRALYREVAEALNTWALRRRHQAADRACTRCVLLCVAVRRRTAALPASLTDLIGPHLAAVPTDPFDGAPLRYDPARALVWSVGENGVDDDGLGPDPEAAGGDAPSDAPDYTRRIPGR